MMPRRALAILCTSLALAACGGSSKNTGTPPGGGNAGVLAGAWKDACSGGAGSWEQATLTVTGTSYTMVLFAYTNDTCTAGATQVANSSGTVTVGTAVNATMGAATVSAFPVDINQAGVGLGYDLVYIDTASNPDRLYFGLSDAQHDGSSAATRPVAIDPGYYMSKQ